MRDFVALAVVVAALMCAAPASAAPNPLNTTVWAQKAVNMGVGHKLDDRLGSLTLDVMRSNCRRTGRSRFRCTFTAVSIDTRWIGSGTVRFRGRGIFRYRLHGRVEECGPDGCEKTGTFRWTGRAAPFG